MSKNIENKSIYLPKVTSTQGYSAEDITNAYRIINDLEGSNVQPIKIHSWGSMNWLKFLLFGFLSLLLFAVFLWLLAWLFPNIFSVFRSGNTENHLISGVNPVYPTSFSGNQQYITSSGTENDQRVLPTKDTYKFQVDKETKKILNSLGTNICIDSKKKCSDFPELERLYCENGQSKDTICGTYLVLIESGSVVPFSGSSMLSATIDGQSSFLAGVFEGDQKWAKQNKSIGNIRLENISPRKEDESMAELIFSVDVNGLLTVTAIDSEDQNHIFEKPFQLNNLSAYSSGLSYTGTELYVVQRVIDGDTIDIGWDANIRILGMDSPESTITRYGFTQCNGDKATEYTKSRLLGRKIRLESDIIQPKKDGYGRYLFHVWEGENLFSNEIIQAGYAVKFDKFETKYSSVLLQSQSNAKNAKKGIWGDCMQ